MAVREVLLAIQESLVAATSKDRDVQLVDGCQIMLSPNDPLSYLNYAVPIDADACADSEAVIRAFRSHGRTPRFEFIRDLWPGVVDRLIDAGFVVDAQMPVMVLGVEDWKRVELPPGVDIRKCGVEDCQALAAVTAAAFADRDEVSWEEPRADYQEAIGSGRWIACLGYADDKLGGGGVGVGDDRIREAAGIGVLPGMRRRGLGSAITAALVQTHFDRGGELVWLTPGDERARSVYAKLGFTRIAEQVCLAYPSA